MVLVDKLCMSVYNDYLKVNVLKNPLKNNSKVLDPQNFLG